MKTKRLMLAGGIALALHGLNPVQASIKAQVAANHKFEASHKAQEQMVAYYVRYSKGKKASITAAMESNNFKVDHEFDRIDTVSVSFPKGQEGLLSALSDVEFFEPVPEHKMLAQVTPWNIDQFQAREVWDADLDGDVDPGAPDGSGVKFCIIDSGFYAAHEDFQGINHTGISQIIGEQYTEDGNGHGTHVAGTANAVNNNIGVVGVMPGGADLHIVKIFNNAGVWAPGQSNLAAAIQDCANNGANAISMSLGGGYSATEEALFQSLYDNNNIIHIAAAGNDGNATRSYPASYESVISVAALDENEDWASFSQFPATSHDPNSPPANTEWDVVELSGGGAGVLSTWPVAINVESDSVQYGATRVAETGLGSVTQNLVDGGLCDTGDIDPSWNGSVVLCERGGFAFADKMNNAADGGGLAVILFNNEPGVLNATCGGNCTSGATIPGVAVSQTDGQFIRNNNIGLSTTVSVVEGSGYSLNSGTSMATPGVAAGIAWAWDACGGPNGITNKQLRQLLRDSAKDLTGANYGAGYDDYTGFGLVQLKDALELGNQLYGSTCPLGFSVTPSEISVCTLPGQVTDAQYAATLDDGFTGTSNMSATGLPAGANGTWSVNPVVHPTNQSTYTVSSLSGLASGSHSLILTATDQSDPNNNASSSVTLNLVDGMPSGLTLSSPANGATNVSSATLMWNPANGAVSYTVEVATDAGFSNIIETASGLTGTSHDVGATLNGNTTYYWRVTAENFCGNVESNHFSFTTATLVCTVYNSVDVPLPIPVTGSSGSMSSELQVNDSGSISDVNVVNLIGTHTYLGDLTFSVESPAATSVELVSGQCGTDEDFDVNFDDSGSGSLPCPYTDGGTYLPSGSLASFNSEEINGVWTLNIVDSAAGDSGNLTGWGLEICYISNTTPSDIIFADGFE